MIDSPHLEELDNPDQGSVPATPYKEDRDEHQITPFGYKHMSPFLGVNKGTASKKASASKLSSHATPVSR